MKMKNMGTSDFFSGVTSYLTEGLPGIGGALKKSPSHFKVIEKMEPVPDRGEHVSLTCTRSSMTTQEVLKRLALLFSIKNKNLLGHAGLKDKDAITTQTISLPLGRNFPLEKVRSTLEESFPELSSIVLQKRETKIKVGELRGNSFEVLLTELNYSSEDALKKIEPISTRIKELGFPNFYGPQRFGDKGDNAERGKAVWLGKEKIRSPWLKNFLLNSYQSKLFNQWLSNRVQEGRLHDFLEGDIVLSPGDTRPFLFGEGRTLTSKERASLTVTGPVFGKKMTLPLGKPLEREEELLRKEGLSVNELKGFPLYGSRREAWVKVPDLTISLEADGLLFKMMLPPGTYATSLLREFRKPSKLTF